MTVLHIDLETRSAVDLKRTGVHAYAESVTTDVWCAAYAIDDEPVLLWVPTEPICWPVPQPIQYAFEKGWEIHSHNATFERAIWRYILTPRYGWPEPKVEQWRCTMAQALAMSLPASLENAAAALGLDIGKDMQGQALMRKMAKPRKVDPDGTIVWWDSPENLRRLYDYCKQDVEVERAIGTRLLPLRPSEQALWVLDQKVNDRGVLVDTALCHAAKKIVAAATDNLDRQMASVTDFEVTACSNTGQLTAFARKRGVDAVSVAKDQLEILLARDDLPADVRRALELRKLAARASVAKIDALLAGTNIDGRARGMLQYHAASTGRWAGRRYQPQNIKRTNEDDDIDAMIADVAHGDIERIEMFYDDPLMVVANCLRGMICAAPGRKMMAADFTSIEGVVLPWLAGEQWKLDAFRAYIAGKAPDMYKVSYGRAFGVDPVTIGKDIRRQIGKIMELALGFGGGPGAFAAMAKGYNVDIGENFDLVCGAAPAQAAKAEAAWRARGKRSGMSERAWIAAEVIKLLWREAHSRVTQFWWDLEQSALEALDNPGAVVHCGKVRFRKAGSFMWLQLPSGRALCYPYPRAVMKEMPWDGEDGRPAQKRVFSYKGVDSYTRKWADCYAYGGLWAENVTQAVARDILAEAMLRLEAAGYPIVLHVHDEAVGEPKAGHGSVEEFLRIMAEPPEWANGCPISAAGWAGPRYKKG